LNPCGCSPPPNGFVDVYISQNIPRCQPTEPFNKWFINSTVDILVVQFGVWYQQNYLWCAQNAEEVEVMYYTAVASIIPTLKGWVDSGRLVYWLGEYPRKANGIPPLDAVFKRFPARNAKVAELLAGSGVPFINPYDLLAERFAKDPNLKQDIIHVNGYDENSIPGWFNRLILFQAAVAKGYENLK
jgi:hypothetical protein